MKTPKYLCPHCGSEDIVADASAIWDQEQEKWILDMIFETGYCLSCENDIDIYPATANDN